MADGGLSILVDKKQARVQLTYGIHRTRGPMFGNFEKPPLPQSVLSWFMADDSAQFLYCSHGCVRLSNQNIEKLFKLTTQAGFAGIKIRVGVT